MSVCKYIQAQSGNGCYDLAQRCGISQDDLVKYNPSNGFCNSVKVGDYVCCSSGSKPDFSPKQASDGSCYSYTSQAGDTCAAIASANQISDWKKIDDWNHNTWGWAGCAKLQVSQRFCLSDGTPPFPQAVSGTVCGPQVPGTKQPAGMSPRSWGDLNPCPLNACCDIWGQCGISAEFCTWTLADTWAPGTAQPGQNGCISNCGTDITNNQDKPDQFRRIGYFEAWNGERNCLNMDISAIDKGRYTHVHYAFGSLSDKWDTDYTKYQDQLMGLVRLTGIKRILSFGGWSFSTDAATQNIFRSGVRPENRDTFARKVVNFVTFMGLDGVDFDWEYPGAQDIPGIPADSPYSGPNYYEFLKIVRSLLPADKSLSIAAPASFWYLKNFPIKDIAQVVDYIVYMTYDMHGQWDYGNKWVDPGCPTGDCLRHHTNTTEVRDALVMITKAGVPAKKVVVGMPLYGRSFKMTQGLCSGENCHYTGPASGAAPGRCTNTAGYISNAEIKEIILRNPNVVQYFDKGDILVYNNTEWVSWMTPSTYQYNQIAYTQANFGGLSDWAMDLDIGLTDVYGDEIPDDYEPPFDPNYYSSCDARYTNINDVVRDQDSIPQHCIYAYLVDSLSAMWDASLHRYDDLINDGYDSKFGTYADYIRRMLPDQLTTFMQNGTADKYFDCKWTDGDKIRCPGACDYQKALSGDRRLSKFDYSLRDSDGFYRELNDRIGVPKAWIQIGEYDGGFTTPCKTKPGTDCDVEHLTHCTGYPFAANQINVPNPKDLVNSGRAKSQDMLDRLRIMRQLQTVDSLMDMADLVDAAELPSLTLIGAVEAMDAAAKLGKEIQDEERKSLIISIISGILFMIPLVGEIAGPTMATVKLIVTLVDVAGTVAFTIYGAVSDPKNAVSTVLLGLLGAGIGRGSWSKAGAARRGMADTELKALGTVFDKVKIINQARLKMCKL